MKNVLFAIAALALMTSCGGNKQTEAESADSVEVVDETTTTPSEEVTMVEEDSEEDLGYKAPIKVVVEREWVDAGYYKTVYTYNIEKNGKLSGTRQEFFRDLYYGGDEYQDRGTTEFSGKWSTTSISRGDGLQTVFAIDPSDRESTIYLPNDCEYIWLCDNAWFECENWNTDRALKVKSVERL